LVPARFNALVQFKEQSLEIGEGLPEEHWVELGKHLARLEKGHQWWIGDWANYGERAYGELKRAAEDAGFEYKTAREYGYVARRFELSIRMDTLTFGHHQAVAALPDEAAFRLLADAERNELSVADLRVLVQREQNTVGELPGSDTCSVRDLELLIAQGKKYGTVYADPPWLYGNQGTRAATGQHYGGMTVEQIAALPIAQLVTEDAHLHLWTTNAFLFEAPQIIEQWGFEYKSCFVWVKTQMGIGNYWRVSHEFLLLAVRGSATFRNRAARSWLETKRGRHSSKPEKIRELIESASPTPYLELFGRRNAGGWTVWGNEIKRTMLDVDVEELA
jgi:N6-adenosine-specific RNA methylase IME4